MRAIAFGLGIALLLLLGCVAQGIGDIERFPEIKKVLDENPDANASVLFLNQEAVTLMIKEIRKACGQNMRIAPYWNVEIKAGKETWEFYIDGPAQNVVCEIKPEEVPPELMNDCRTGGECNDGIASTKDECKGTPRKCLHTEIVECVSNDGYCPAGCAHASDRDCPAVDLCQVDSDCTDTNSFTKDFCKGTPKECVHELKTCEEVNGFKCEVYEACPEKELSVKGTGQCCEVECVKTKSCEGIKCPEEQKCVLGNCIDKSCKERNLPLCTQHEICAEEFYTDTFGVTCCTGECKRPCASNAECQRDYVCNLGYCIAVSCLDIGGRTCDEKIEKCIGEMERTLDNNYCCLECALKTCDERQGFVCDLNKGEECPKEFIEVLDTEECCPAECEVNPCFNKVCAVNRKCDEETGKCVFKACGELFGTLCDENSTCDGPVYETSNVKECCTGNCVEG